MGCERENGSMSEFDRGIVAGCSGIAWGVVTEGGMSWGLLEGVVGGVAWSGVIRKEILLGDARGIIMVKELAPSRLLSHKLAWCSQLFQ